MRGWWYLGKANTELWGEAKRRRPSPGPGGRSWRPLETWAEVLDSAHLSLLGAPRKRAQIWSPRPLVAEPGQVEREKLRPHFSFLLNHDSGRSHLLPHPTPIVLTSQFPQPST